MPALITTTMDYIEEESTSAFTSTTETGFSSSLSSDEPQTVSPTIMDMWMEQLQRDHPEISFVIPSHQDNQHIDNMVQFKKLLEKVGNTAYDTFASHHQTHEPPQHLQSLVDSSGQMISHEQISKSAVLNMADLNQSQMWGFERFFDGSDMHSLINYLWIGVVTALVILSVVFILFSVYFYRKFRDWKKCNKDIRAHLHNDQYPGTLIPCSLATNPEAAYYQMQNAAATTTAGSNMKTSAPPPPCYTIATGLPTYDEALHNHHHQQHYAFGMKFIYPTLAAVHHHHHQHQQQQQQIALTMNVSSQQQSALSSWEKYDMTLKEQQQQKNNEPTAYNQKPQEKSSVKCKSSAAMEQHQQSSKQTVASILMPPSYDLAASMALLADTVTEMEEQQEDHSKSDLTDIITV